ncbi:hypothetical protein JK358_28260 [Nocardia sp. 2]|uniref:Uncharacterized protein n=1 Tax=Nocardia acididurans TaxID=2802282 RepID=A0ABS1MCK0_9NOCA|nr:hypothetical protein [Nocardia acididurans]MBL1078307.1 hypothetical protein [Nocardia acididurans]
MRLREALEVVTVCLAAAVAGLTVMVPIDPTVGETVRAPGWVELVVFDVPRATMAAAFVVVLGAVFTVMMSVSAGWAVATLVSAGLFVDQVLWSGEIGSQSVLIYVDSVLAGMLMGAVGTLAWYRRPTASAFLLGAMSGVLLGDFTPAPAPGEQLSAVQRFVLDSPTLPVAGLLVVLAAACAFTHRRQPATVRKLVDVVPLRPALVAGLVFPTILLTSEWFARSGRALPVLVVGVVLIVLAAFAGALVLPGRDGMLLLLMVAFAAAGSTPITVPRPDWTILIFLAAVAVGLFAGYRRGLPLLAAALTGALAVASLATVLTGAHGALLAVASGTAVAFVGGYCLGAATPLFPTIPPLCVAVLFVPSAAVALWGRDFERVGYSEAWYRPTEPARALAPGVVALAITAGCALGIAALYRIRPTTKEAIRGAWARMQAASTRPRRYRVLPGDLVPAAEEYRAEK